MNTDDEIYKYQPLWGNWYIELPIGKGSFGSVYRISREDMGRKYTAAVKFITVPNDEQRKEAEASLGDDEDTLSEYFGDIVRNIVSEIDMLYALSGNSNIISYQDHEVRKRQQGIGWDILIRMEYVTSLRKYLKEHSMTVENVIRLGIDICTALETCSKKGIIHRDIKDDNIFVSDDGVFKLGDFGIARELSKSGRAASMRGTPLYMAPEIFRGEKYDAAVDIYSLGIVLYKLLNYGRMPLVPPYPEKVRYQDSEDALEKRMSGVELPPPASASGMLAKVTLKACAYKAEERYTSPGEMKRELENIFAGMGEGERKRSVGTVAGKAEVSAAITELYDSAAVETKREELTSATIGAFPQSSIGTFHSSQHEKLDETVGIMQGEQLAQEPVQKKERTIIPQKGKKEQHFTLSVLLIYIIATLFIFGVVVIIIGLSSYSNSHEGFSINNGVLINYYGNESSITIPEGVTEIQDDAFFGNNNITSVVMSDSVSSIGSRAFSGCNNLDSITLSTNIKSIESYTFSGCSKLTSINIPQGVNHIEEYAFAFCYDLSSITIPESVSSIGDSAFYDCFTLSSIVLGQGVSVIGEHAFAECINLVSITIPSNVKTIGYSAFDDCKNLVSLIIPSSVTNIQNGAFCDLEKLTIYGELGTYAERYAKENGIPFIAQ